MRDFDIIYHMENGRIIESGTHDELIAARGKYYEMFTHQAENYRSVEQISCQTKVTYPERTDDRKSAVYVLGLP